MRLHEVYEVCGVRREGSYSYVVVFHKLHKFQIEEMAPMTVKEDQVFLSILKESLFFEVTDKYLPIQGKLGC